MGAVRGTPVDRTRRAQSELLDLCSLVRSRSTIIRCCIGVGANYDERTLARTSSGLNGCLDRGDGHRRGISGGLARGGSRTKLISLALCARAGSTDVYALSPATLEGGGQFAEE